MWDIVKPVMRYIHPASFQMIFKLNVKELKTLRHTPKVINGVNRYFHNSHTVFKKINYEETDMNKSVALFDAADRKKKEKSSFLNIIYTYESEGPRKSGHVTFVYAALRNMDAYGVNEDLEVYKKILDTMPKGRYVASTLFQAELMHYPREQQCIIDLLQKMENNGVIPDPEMEEMVINISGHHGHALRKFRRIAYWSTKFKNLNPWPIPRPLTSDALELAKIAIHKIATVDVQSTVTIFDTKNVKDSIDKTWIVSASSPDQENLISSHPKDIAIYVEGPYRIWLLKESVDYFILRADVLERPPEEVVDYDDVSKIEISLWKIAKKKKAQYRSIHEQDDQIILGVCATGTSSKDSLLSWIRCLEIRNPALASIPVLFKFIGPVDDVKRICQGEEIENTEPKEIPGKVETNESIPS